MTALGISERMSVADSYRRMVAQAAWTVWRRLPQHTKTWVSIDDMITEGMEWLVCEGLVKWREEKGSVSTFVNVAVANYFEDKYGRHYRVGSRGERRLVSLHEVPRRTMDGRLAALEVAIPGLQDIDSADRIFRSCFVVPVMVRVHKRASENLREELVRWFVPQGNKRLHLSTKRFLSARQEFRRLAGAEGLEVGDCRHLLYSVDCSRRLMQEIHGSLYGRN